MVSIPPDCRYWKLNTPGAPITDGMRDREALMRSHVLRKNASFVLQLHGLLQPQMAPFVDKNDMGVFGMHVTNEVAEQINAALKVNFGDDVKLELDF
jgi:hypothetical protein